MSLGQDELGLLRNRLGVRTGLTRKEYHTLSFRRHSRRARSLRAKKGYKDTEIRMPLLVAMREEQPGK